MATKAKKPKKAKSEGKAPKAEKVMGYFRKDSTVGVMASMVTDEKAHKIDTLLANTQKAQGVDAAAAQFALKVLFTNKYPGNKIGKIQYQNLGHATVNLAEETVQFRFGNGKTKSSQQQGEKKASAKPKSKDKAEGDSKAAEPSQQKHDDTLKTAVAGSEPTKTTETLVN